MSAKAALAEIDFELVLEDGVPLETQYHQLQMQLFLELVHRRMAELGRDDFFAGGNIFVYYPPEQARAVAEEERQLALFENGFRAEPPKKVAYRGPDAFLVKGVDPRRERQVWVVWEEDGRFPDLVLELLSPSTAAFDRGEKKRIYERIFKSSEYFLYQPRSRQAEGWRLFDNSYQRITPGSQGRLWSRELEVELGVWHGVYRREAGLWLRLFYPDGGLVPTQEEQIREERQRADAERQRADAERQRADTAEAELAHLRARLAEIEG